MRKDPRSKVSYPCFEGSRMIASDFVSLLSGQLEDQDISVPETDEQEPKFVHLHHPFFPRLEELVLFSPSVKGELELVQDVKDGSFKLWDPTTSNFAGHPEWMCGDVMGLSRPEQTEATLQVSEVLINCLEVVGSDQRSKPERWVPVQHVRPLVFWKELLANTPASLIHNSVRDCLTEMKVFKAKVTMENCNFQQTAQKGSAPVKRSLLGPEVICVGDFVRVEPRTPGRVTQVLEVTNIIVTLEGATMGIVTEYQGYGYTTDKLLSKRGQPGNVPVAAIKGHDGPWFPLVSLDDPPLRVSTDSIIGRLYEAEVVQGNFPCSEEQLLDVGRQGVIEGRKIVRDVRSTMSSG